MKRKAVFLDRDGIVNREIGDYIQRFEEFELLPELIPFLYEVKKRGYLCIIITNQAGIAKGLYNHELVDACHEFMNVELAGHQLSFDAIYYCPHHPDFNSCLCRKPQSLLVEKAIGKFDLDPNLCLMIGDKERDVQAAEGAVVKGYKLPANPSLNQLLECLPH
ncbi:MAG: HAD-IIIA family hydrolase [Bacteroidia bacterium]